MTIPFASCIQGTDSFCPKLDWASVGLENPRGISDVYPELKAIKHYILLEPRQILNSKQLSP